MVPLISDNKQCVRHVGSEAVRRCDATRRLSDLRVVATLRCCATSRSPRVFATLRCLWGALLASSRLRDTATLRCCRGARRLFASSRRCDAAVGELLASSRHQIWLRAAARFFAMARCCVDASDAATLQPWGGWWVGLHAVVTSMYWLKRWGLDQIFIFANKQ